MRQYLLPETGNFYKANLHCHTILSDGKQTPEEVKRVFMEKGYSAVAFTDHELMLDHSDLSDENFVALTAYEYGFDKSPEKCLSALYEGELLSHEHREKVHLNLISKDPHDTRMVCCDLNYIWGNAKLYLDQVKYVGDPHYKRKYSAEGVNEVIRAARERDMLVVFNHPNWSMNTYAFYSKLEGLTGYEIINGDANRESDMEYTPHVYQELARLGKRMICVAGDDNHSNHSSGFAWTMIKAESLTYGDLIKGLEAGDCYASDGPEIHDLYVEDGAVTIRCSEAASIHFYTAGRRMDAVHAKPGSPLLTEAAFRLEPADLMFRVTVRDAHGNHACTRYYYFDELKTPIV